MDRSTSEVLLVGMEGGTHVGGSFRRAAADMACTISLASAKRAFDAPRWHRMLTWHLLDHRPPKLKEFSRSIVDQVRSELPDVLLATGIAPLTREALRVIGSRGVRRVCYLTDDPWNPTQGSQWFRRALPEYDLICTPRHANEDQLRAVGCEVRYIPFAYDPELFAPVELTEEEKARLHAEVLFVGGADDDRARLVRPLLQAGIDVALYGRYWERYDDLTPYARGFASPEILRKATRAADVALCLVRRANRDGHVMRSFEIPAIGACMLVERTDEHRALFSGHGDHVHYFDTPSELVAQARWLLDHSAERNRLAESVHAHVTNGKHTYRDRLETMLKMSSQVS